MRDKYGVDIDPDCYPDTATLINLLEIQSESELEEAELELTSFRLEQFTLLEKAMVELLGCFVKCWQCRQDMS